MAHVEEITKGNKLNKNFLISDHHWNHRNLLNFKRDDGTPLRHFTTVEEMNEHMIEAWNKVVTKDDKVYHLGDLCFKLEDLDAIMPRLNGTKVLIKGNHDQLGMHQYMKYFKDVRAYHRLDNLLLSHIPIHPSSLGFKTPGMIHGHTHYRNVTMINAAGEEVLDPRYINVSVEVINYTPIEFEEVRQNFIASGAAS